MGYGGVSRRTAGEALFCAFFHAYYVMGMPEKGPYLLWGPG
jgi:hypothetical protein